MSEEENEEPIENEADFSETKITKAGDIHPPEPMGLRMETMRPQISINSAKASQQPAKQMVAEAKETEGKNDLEKPKSNFKIFIFAILGLILVGGGILFLLWQKGIVGNRLAGPLGSPVAVTPSSSAEPSPEILANINDEQRKSDLEAIKEALMRYYQANSKYPIGTNIKTSDTSTLFYQALVPNILETMPVDPSEPDKSYTYNSSGDHFTLTAQLDDKTDSSGVTENNQFVYKLTD